MKGIEWISWCGVVGFPFHNEGDKMKRVPH